MTEYIKDTGKEGCPSNEVFLDFFLTNKSRREREVLLKHLRDCNECRVKVRVLMDVDSSLKKCARRLRPLARASFREIRAFSRPSRARTAAVWGRRFAAVGAGAGVILSVFLLAGTIRPDGNLRGSKQALGRLSLPNGSISAAPRLFAWNSVFGGEYYRFELIDDRLQVLFSERTNRAWIIIPESVQKKLRREGTYIWTVEAFNEDESKIGEIRKYFDFR